MDLEVKIEIRSIVKKITSRLADGNTHNFTVLVCGLNGNEIEHFVKQVIFYLPFDSNSKQVKRKPPYFISGSTQASFRLPIDILLYTSEARNKVRYSYYVYLPDKLVENAVNVKTLTFLNSPLDFRKRLLLGGAEMVERSNSAAVATQVKSEPVEIIENQNESLGHEKNPEFQVVSNNEAVDSEDASKENEENLVCKIKPSEGSDIQNESPNSLVQSKDISKQNGSLFIQDIYSFDELLKENEILKNENEALYNKFRKQEGVIATYVEKLPVLQDKFSTVSIELGQLQKKAEVNETEISSLKSAIQTLKSEILQKSNKVDEIKGQIKKLKKPAMVSSSFVSECFPSMTSICLQNGPNANSSHGVLIKDPLIFDFKNGNLFEKAAPQCLEIEPHTHASSLERRDFEPGYLNSQNFRQDSFQIICKSISGLATQKGIEKEAQHSSLGEKDEEHAILKSGKPNMEICIGKLSTLCDSLGRQANIDTFGEVAPQESSLMVNELVDLNSKEIDLVLPDSTNSHDYSSKELCKNVLGETNQYIKDDLQIIDHEEHRNSSPIKKNSVPKVLKMGSCQNVIDSNCRNDLPVFSSHQKDAKFAVLSCSKRDLVNELQISTKDCLMETPQDNIFQEVTQKQIKSKSSSKRKNIFTSLSCKEKNCESTSVENTSLSLQKELTKHLSEKAIQEYVVSGLQTNLNQQRDLAVSDFIHLKKPSLNMKRTLFLPIPQFKKRPSLSSIVFEQVCSQAENSLDTVTIEDKTPIGSKNAAPESNSTLKSVDKNPRFSADTDRNQPASTCISTNLQFQKEAKNKGFKKRNIEADSSDPIGSIFKDIDDRLICEAKQNYYVHLLTEFLINPRNCSDISGLIFLVIQHLQQTTKNYLLAFKEDRANCIFLPSSESCIVSTLFEIEKKSETYLQLKLVKNILNTIHHLLMAAKTLNADGLASLCRVFTEICKRKNDLMKPLLLCVEILKKKLHFAPYLIASIAGVWREPFMLPSDQSEEAMILLGSISLGVGKKTKKLNENSWLCSLELISEYFGFPSLPDVNVAITFLKDKIISNCIQNLHEKSWMVTSSFVILAAYQPWEWTKKHLINDYIIPNLSKFAEEEPNEKAFALFCDLCVDVYNLSHSMPYRILLKYYRQAPNKGSNFVKEWAAVSLIKYIILSRNKIRCDISDWLENNQKKLIVEDFREFYLRKNVYYNGLKNIIDVVIT